MEKVLKFKIEIEPFMTVDGIMCQPDPIDGGWILPLGWEDELDVLGVDYDVFDYVSEDT
jgi:hypothetical protein